MYEDLESSLENALEFIRAARAPQPVPTVMSLADMAREAVRIGGEGSHVQLECHIGRDGRVDYNFSVWDGNSRIYASSDNQQEALQKFAAKKAPLAPEPDPTPAEQVESVVLGRVLEEVPGGF